MLTHHKLQDLQAFERATQPKEWDTPSKPKENITSSITGFQPFPVNSFKYFLTLFSKFFSSFPHGTCSLSVSRQYLALEELYLPFRAALPSNSTLWTHIVRGWLRIIYGVLTLYDTLFQRIYIRADSDRTSLGYNATSGYTSRFPYWALPASLAVTRGILVSFFSSP